MFRVLAECLARFPFPCRNSFSVTNTTGSNDRSRVLVRLANGRTIYVDADHVYGDYAVHQWVASAPVENRGFTVTHRPSGISIWSVQTYKDALRVASHLEESKLLPHDPLVLEHMMEEVYAGKSTDGVRTIHALRDALAKIATRVVPPSPQQWNVGALT